MSAPEDVQARPTIKRGCWLCGVTVPDIEAGMVIVSPAGIAHYGRDDGETDCGKNATGENWWWPL